MRRTILIARRELATYFDSLIAYILLVVFLGLSGFFTWWFGSDVFMRGQADLTAFFNIAYWTLFFFIPALTMRSLAEERKSGTLELLLTKAVSDREVVLGKFLAVLALIAIALLGTLPYYMSVAFLGPMDHGAALCGYLALLMMSAAYAGIGLYASSITTNQITAFLLALLIASTFHILFGLLASDRTGISGQVLGYLSTGTHFDSMSRGVIDLRDMVFFITLSIAGIGLAEFRLAERGISTGEQAR